MKQLKYILSTFVLLVPVLMHAQTEENPLPIYSTHQYNRQNGIATGKSVSAPDENGVYTLTLETFATGMRSIISKAIPSDIVLILDYSTSMLMSGSAQPNSASATRTRLYDLKNAVGEFVTMMKDNNATMHLDDDQMGNRIAFVLFAGQLYSETQPTTGTNGIFYGRHLNEFLEVDDLTVDNTLIEHHPVWTNGSAGHDYPSTSVFYDGDDIIRPSSQYSGRNPGHTGISNQIDMGDVNKSTNSAAAMQRAQQLVDANLRAYPLTERTTVVVFFTDGEPSSGSGFNGTIANNCINAAHSIKEEGVLVYTIGLVEGSDDTDQVKTYLEYTSSDWSELYDRTNPTAMPAAANYLNRNTDYGDYSFKVSEDATLSDIFKTIGEASGGSESTIPGETQVVDAVSSSFEIPSTFTASDVTIYTRSINEEGDDWENQSSPFTKVILPDNYDLTALPPADIATQIANENTVGVYLKDGKLVVIGFDYSKADSEDAYDGNWVGWREGDKKAAGKELVIEFNVEAIEGVTGGDGTNTNSPESGVLVPTFDKDGNFTGYVNQINYPYPQTDLPINIEIHKEGLNHGESATIQIYRAPQKIGKFDPVTGKPAPDVETDDDWENFSKVILTNKEDDGETVIKKLVSLDPSYVYRLVEDNWGFGYYLDTYDINTSEKEANPFVFTNTKKATGTETTETTVVKHAEAVSINHFGQSDPDKRVENYKSNEEFDKK